MLSNLRCVLTQLYDETILCFLHPFFGMRKEQSLGLDWDINHKYIYDDLTHAMGPKFVDYLVFVMVDICKTLFQMYNL